MKDKLKKFYADRRNEINIAAGVTVGVVIGVTYMTLSKDEVTVNGAEIYEDAETGEYRLRVDFNDGTERHLRKA